MHCITTSPLFSSVDANLGQPAAAFGVTFPRPESCEGRQRSDSFYASKQKKGQKRPLTAVAFHGENHVHHVLSFFFLNRTPLSGPVTVSAFVFSARCETN